MTNAQNEAIAKAKEILQPHFGSLLCVWEHGLGSNSFWYGTTAQALGLSELAKIHVATALAKPPTIEPEIVG